jgi:hypothetical protein
LEISMKIILSFLLTVSGPGAFAADAASATNSAATAQTFKDSQSQVDSIRDSAANTQSDNNRGQTINLAIGGGLLAAAAACQASCPHGCCPAKVPLFMMGIASLAQAAAQGSTAGQAGFAVGATNVGPGEQGSYDPHADDNKITNDPTVKSGIDFGTAVTSGKTSLGGATYDKKTGILTTPSGQTYKASDFNSPQSMAAAGISPSVIDQVSDMVKKIEKDATKKADKALAKAGASSEESALGGGGGSGFTAGSGGDGATGYPGAAGLAKEKLGVNRDPAQVAGMQKNYNGEPIGVAGDSIFNMMTRRYRVKESQSSFYDGSELLQK